MFNEDDSISLIAKSFIDYGDIELKNILISNKDKNNYNNYNRDINRDYNSDIKNENKRDYKRDNNIHDKSNLLNFNNSSFNNNNTKTYKSSNIFNFNNKTQFDASKIDVSLLKSDNNISSSNFFNKRLKLADLKPVSNVIIPKSSISSEYYKNNIMNYNILSSRSKFNELSKLLPESELNKIINSNTLKNEGESKSILLNESKLFENSNNFVNTLFSPSNEEPKLDLPIQKPKFDTFPNLLKLSKWANEGEIQLPKPVSPKNPVKVINDKISDTFVKEKPTKVRFKPYYLSNLSKIMEEFNKSEKKEGPENLNESNDSINLSSISKIQSTNFINDQNLKLIRRKGRLLESYVSRLLKENLELKTQKSNAEIKLKEIRDSSNNIGSNNEFALASHINSIHLEAKNWVSFLQELKNKSFESDELTEFIQVAKEELKILLSKSFSVNNSFVNISALKPKIDLIVV